MKYFLILLGAILASSLSSLRAIDDPITKALQQEGADGKIVAEGVRKLPATEQAAILNEVADRVRAASENCKFGDAYKFGDETNTPTEMDKFAMHDYISVAAGLLSEIGTDDQIVRAFEKLDRFGFIEADAAFALSACKSSKGAKIVETVAMEKLEKVGPQLSSTPDKEGKRQQTLLLSFMHFLKKLAASSQIPAQEAAKRLQDEFAKRYDSELGKKVLGMFQDEIRREIEARKHSVPKPEGKDH